MHAIVGTISHAVAAALFALLSIQLISSWRGRRQGALLTVAAVLTTLWALVATYFASQGTITSEVTELVQTLRDGAWLAFLLDLLRRGAAPEDGPLNRRAALAVGLLVALILAARLAAAVIGEAVWLPGGLAPGWLGGLGLALAGLVLVEQVFRNSAPEARWAIKFLCLGLGGLFAYDFFLYSDALLFRRLDPALVAARGFVDALVVPLIAVSVVRNPHWSVDVFVSRRIVFHSTALLGSGIYLLAMAAGGYYIRYYGGTWGVIAQAVFLFGAGMVLLVILFSGQIRAHVKVFLSKHFFSYRYDYRDEWLRLTGTLSSGEAADGRLAERAVKALAAIVDSPGGALWIQDEFGTHGLAARWNVSGELPASQAADSSLLAFLAARRWVVDRDECRVDPERYPGLQLPAWLLDLPDAWLVVPLMHHDALLGCLVLLQPRAPRRLDWEDYDVLKTAARQAASYVAQDQAARALVAARQFEAYNRLSTFVVHDLKNLIAQLSLVVDNAARHKHNPEFMEDAIDTVSASVARMQRLLEQLRATRDDPQAQAGPLEPVEVGALVRQVVLAHAAGRPTPSVQCPEPVRIIASPERLASVIGHVLQNAQEATADEGWVRVTVGAQGSIAVVDIEDNGSGMEEQFVRERLFRPFDSTKGSKGMGIGAYQSREVIRSLGGEVTVHSRPGHGTRFTIRLPLATAGAVATKAAAGS